MTAPLTVSSLRLTDGCQGGEAVVETVEKSPAFVIREDKGSRGPDNEGEEENHHDQVNLQRRSLVTQHWRCFLDISHLGGFLMFGFHCASNFIDDHGGESVESLA